MSRDASTGQAGEQADTRKLFEEALQAVNKACGMIPIQCLEEVDFAERAIVRLRDALIAQRRAGEPGWDARSQAALDQVNGSLSLVIGVEYPATGSQRRMLQAATVGLARALKEWPPD